jgi:hypothetical protein
MDRKQTLKLAPAILLAGFVLLSTAMAEDYQILWTRPSHTGQKIQIAGTASDSEKTVLSGAVSRTEEKAYEVGLKALEEVLEVDVAKRPCKASLVIDKFVMKNNDAETELLPKGAKILATAGEEKTVFEMDGKPVDARVNQALSLLIALDGNSKKPTDDEMYGSKARRKVGERWPVHKESLISSLRAQGMDVRAEDVAGTVTLRKAIKEKEGKSLLLTMKLDLRNLKMPDSQGFTVKSASSTVEGIMLAPTDIDRGILTEFQKATRTIEGKGLSKDGKEISVESVGTAGHVVKYTYPAKAK